jgi:hypothetical protein
MILQPGRNVWRIVQAARAAMLAYFGGPAGSAQGSKQRLHHRMGYP